MTDSLLQVRNLKKYFPVERGFLRRGSDFIRAVDDISFAVARGTILGLIGESGCGKTTTVKTIMRAVPPTSGSIEYTTQDDRLVDLAQLTRKELKPLRKELQMIFQDPFSSLNPRMTALDIVAEPLKVLKWRKPAYRLRVEELMDLVGLDPRFLSRYPHAFSGGQRQRLGIARALASSPSLLFADEPVSALDVSVQAQILNLLLDIQAQMGLTVVIIAHDLGVVRYICKEVAIMYLGKIVEQGDTREIYTRPQAPLYRRHDGGEPGHRSRYPVGGGPAHRGRTEPDRRAPRLRVRVALQPRRGTLPQRSAGVGAGSRCRPHGSLLARRRAAPARHLSTHHGKVVVPHRTWPRISAPFGHGRDSRGGWSLMSCQ